MSDYDIVLRLDPTQPAAGAKVVAGAVAQVETQGKKAQEAMDGVASAAKSLKSIDFKQAAAAGAQAWSILSQKFELGNTLLGKAIDSTVKFAALGAQLGGPWGAALGGIAGLLIEVTDDVTGLRSEVTKLAEESKKLSDDAIAKMGGRLGELAREAKKSAGELQKMNDGLFALPGALAATFDAFNKERDIVKRAREEIEKYNAAKFAASPQGNLAKGLVSGVFGREAKKPTGERTYNNGPSLLDTYDGGQQRTPYMGLGEAAGTDPLEVYDLMKLAQDDLNEKITANAEETLKLAQNTRAWNEELEATTGYNAIIGDQLKSAATTLSDALVDAAHGADVSWRSLFENILTGFEKAIAQALVLQALTGAVDGSKGKAGYGGLFGLLGFATGGVIAPSGSGTTDTQTVMFRKSPSETVHINTPQQEAAYRGGGGGPVNLRVVNQNDSNPRALAQALDGAHGERLVLNVLRRNRGALKALME